MYCLCVNVHCTAATGCQPNAVNKYDVYHIARCPLVKYSDPEELSSYSLAYYCCFWADPLIALSKAWVSCDCGFEYRRGYGCVSFVTVASCASLCSGPILRPCWFLLGYSKGLVPFDSKGATEWPLTFAKQKWNVISSTSYFWAILTKFEFFFTDNLKGPQSQIWRMSAQWEPCSFMGPDGRTDRHDKRSMRFSRICERA